jgi:hypothetical protein
MELHTSTIAIIAAAIGGGFAAMIGGIFAFWNAWLQRRHEERRQIRELAVQMALENSKAWRDRTKGTPLDRIPLIGDSDGFLIHSMYLVSALDGRLKTAAQIKAHLAKSFDVVQAASEEIQKKRDEHLLKKTPHG